jgi:hypothetical protein
VGAETVSVVTVLLVVLLIGVLLEVVAELGPRATGDLATPRALPRLNVGFLGVEGVVLKFNKIPSSSIFEFC